MIDFSFELPITLSAACALPQLRRNGRKPHKASMYRWVTSGCRGITLESAIVAGSRVTTSEAVDRWIVRLSEPRDSQTTMIQTPAGRDRKIQRASSDLEQEGW